MCHYLQKHHNVLLSSEASHCVTIFKSINVLLSSEASHCVTIFKSITMCYYLQKHHNVLLSSEASHCVAIFKSITMCHYLWKHHNVSLSLEASHCVTIVRSITLCLYCQKHHTVSLSSKALHCIISETWIYDNIGNQNVSIAYIKSYAPSSFLSMQEINSASTLFPTVSYLLKNQLGKRPVLDFTKTCIHCQQMSISQKFKSETTRSSIQK